MKTKLVQDLIDYLKEECNSELQYEALWCLTNIASGPQLYTHEIIVKGAVPRIVNLLRKSSDYKVKE